ncbi:UNVERIFIED_CONTAM: hypothetical protein GTU68_000246 [Idotea baltica]|nr:hypothetical protein [Idotea baltica]
MSGLGGLTARPADALLGLMTAFREDTRTSKIDLGVGIYKDDSGATPVMTSVAKAEGLILQRQQTKAYEGPRGNADFCAAIEGFIFGDGAPEILEARTASFTTPGGCGALFLGVGLMKRMGAKSVWVSNPTWPNHPKLIQTQGLALREFRYAEDGRLAFDAMLEDVSKAEAGDGVILQGPCHNPTGIDLTPEQFSQVAALATARGLIVMLDVAYHGFAKGLTEDMAGVRAFLKAAPEAMVSYSCSKNFGLYRERTGCFVLKGAEASAVAAASTHVAELARTSYSMPPAHGSAIVATILGDAGLRAEWEAELTDMRERMIGLRTGLADALVAKTGSNRLAELANQNGMFSQLPVTAEAAEAMRKEHGLYMPGSGRINIAGLKATDTAQVAEIVAKYL